MAVLKRLLTRRTLLYAAGGTLTTAGGLYYLSSSPGPSIPSSSKETRRPPPPWTPPSRAEMLNRLKASNSGNDEDVFDLLIIGGGATGAGVAVDAASRGLKVALVEQADFGSGTSSKSTKLVHGGVRYLQKAIFELDYQQYKLVREALHERRIFLQTAPYLSHMLPIMLPIYKHWQVPYYWAGCKLYDVLAGKENMESSYFLSKGKAMEIFPMLKSEGLVGAVVYYDGQHNDSRMNIALILTAIKHGATISNYTSVTSFTKDPTTNHLTGALVTDTLTSTSFPIRARGIINATGPFTDSLLALDNPAHKPIVQASSGIHITLPNYYSPRKMGLLDPATSDGRVIFFLPWEGNTIAGTTDTPWGQVRVGEEPKASEEEIRWVLDEVRSYLAPDIKVRRGDVLSAWSGLRPLVRNPNVDSDSADDGNGKTAGLVRSHVLHLSPSGLLTIAGGKWTTYRKMAEETVDEAVRVFGLEGRVRSGCVTERVRLVGSDAWSRNMFIGLIQTYGLETEVARHLSDNYGDRAWTVCSLAEPTGEPWPLYGKRIAAQYPFIEAEILYAIRHEYAQTAIDVLARRTRLSSLNARAALHALPRVVEVMSEEMGWDGERRRREVREGVEFLEGSMGLVLGGGGGVGGKEGKEEVLKEVVEETLAKVRVPKRGSSWLGLGGIWSAWNTPSPSPSPPGGLTTPPGTTPSSSSPSSAIHPTHAYTRALFEPGELALLKTLFLSKATKVPVSGSLNHVNKSLFEEGMVESVLGVGDVLGVLRGGFEAQSSPYATVTQKEYEYVLKEAGLQGREWLNFEEFVEVCGNLKEVSSVAPPSKSTQRIRRLRIPVEKSGGGV
ncbi:glycerol-3-phosphate dehydrogenase [Coprinopsis cinerea okayama7|uniref:Glycerol-3-phosphate dehydrogenase n=1 Tax=Coprinopsis cinerea (strain Okayama-7 / 130 / ATCC MYA-4618 / FGSC 9003) TaxID=240176 RepID=A8NPX3_COPC7|nr:glycerol-3-phosphate dehydrogenase [Coprinopsis cinerea okayama7\|eukprot:XP_001835425.2 glycerol-3-phosphate dehydrogenase [Coprinopsis cinerea okayama7\